MSYLFQFIATAVALYFATRYVPGIHHTSSSALLVFVVVLTICNLILGTTLRIITFPLKFLTLGLSSIVISLAMIYVTDRVVTGVNLDGIIPVVIVAAITSTIAMIFRVFR